ncbi:tyrosine-type recombinase/integrase [Rosenbergiella epipactidis]|uniref:tyrosine-type recombinase/integrase n=1 Tax=Rosenbergiella epipactidis TaxID=1544694 RepID=UPI00240DD104|nr:tyrosine-type recombinase/integrase [Rosenbergiella epipactidis]
MTLHTKAQIPFTKRYIAQLQSTAMGEQRTIDTSDGGQSGLVLRCRPNGNASFIARICVAGGRVTHTLGYADDMTIENAREWVRNKKTELRRLSTVHGDSVSAVLNMDFQALLQHYTQDILNTGSKRSAHTDLSKINKYLIPLLGQYKLSELNESVVNRYLSGLALKDSTKNRHLALIKAVFNYARRMRFIKESPVEFIRMKPENTSQRNAMTREDFECWFAQCGKAYHQQPGHAGLALLMFLGLTGLRLGETRHLRLEDINWSRKTIVLRQTKNGKTHLVPVCDKAFVLLTEIRQYLGDKGWVFPNTASTAPVSEPRRLQKALCTKAGISAYTIHELRHTFATRLVETGADIHTVKELLGHSSIKVTEIYLHASPARFFDVINRAVA